MSIKVTWLGIFCHISMNHIIEFLLFYINTHTPVLKPELLVK